MCPFRSSITHRGHTEVPKLLLQIWAFFSCLLLYLNDDFNFLRDLSPGACSGYRLLCAK